MISMITRLPVLLSDCRQTGTYEAVSPKFRHNFRFPGHTSRTSGNLSQRFRLRYTTLGYSGFVDVQNSITGTDRWSLGPGLVSLMTVAALTLVCRLPGTFSFLMIRMISLLGYAIGTILILATLATTVFLAITRRP